MEGADSGGFSPGCEGEEGGLLYCADRLRASSFLLEFSCLHWLFFFMFWEVADWKRWWRTSSDGVATFMIDSMLRSSVSEEDLVISFVVWRWWSRVSRRAASALRTMLENSCFTSVRLVRGAMHLDLSRRPLGVKPSALQSDRKL